MKMLSRLISAAFILLCAASCNPAEINNDTPDNPQDPEQPGQPQQSELKFSASILKTRVDYSNEDGDSLNPVWEVGDVLYGFYGDDTDHSIILRVVSVDESGKASLNLEYITGSVANITDDTSVHLIYTGAHIESGASITPSDYAFTNGELSVSLTSQNPPRIPVCMSASAKPTNSGGGDRYISFSFQKDCAIIEIDGLPGLAEDWCITSETALSGITVSGLCLNGKYTFNNEELTFGADNSVESPSSISFTGCKVDSKGAIENSSGSKILIAVVPNGSQTFTIKASTAEKQDISIPYGDKTLEKDKCYVITAKPVVAKIDFGSETKYYQSVAAAFDDAYYAYGEGVTGLTVILIKDQIEGLGTQMSHDWSQASTIVIDYPVSLDLNGCTLSLSGTEGFEVNYIDVYTPATFTITDSNGLNDAKYEGKIKSTSSNPIIINNGDVIIDGGELYYTFFDGPDKYNGRYSMIDNEGGSLTIDNDSYLQADGSIPDDDEECYLIKNFLSGTLKVNSGYLYSFDDEIITIGNSAGGTVTISGGEVYSDVAIAIHNDSNCTIKDGEVSSGSSDAVLNSGSLEIDGGAVYSNESHAVNSKGGSITIDQLDNTVETSVYSNSYDYPAIYVTNDGSNTAYIYMKGGEVVGCGNFDESKGIKICGAIELKGNVNGSISGGLIQANNTRVSSPNDAGYALYVHDGSNCTISGGMVRSHSDFLPSVFCYSSATTDDGTSLTISNGTIIGNTGGVYLEGKVTGTFTGGEVDTIYGGSAVLVNNGSVCTISGGKYYKAAKSSQDPTIRAFGRQNAGTKLTIGWPDGETTVGETHEPLIYVSDPTRACVGADLYGSEESYATVELLGGYYYIDYFDATKHNKTFFTRSMSASIEQFGFVYTNQTGFKNGSKVNSLDETSSSLTVNGKLIKAVAESSPISVRCQLNGQTKEILFAYHVAPVEQ